MKMGQTIIKMYRNMLTLPQSIFSRDVGIMKNKFNKIKEEIIKQMTDCQPKNSNDGKKKKKRAGVITTSTLVFFKFVHAQLITAVSMDRRCTG